MGNTPPRLRRDAMLRGCAFSPLPHAHGHAVTKRLKRGLQGVLRSSRKRMVKTFLSVRFRYARRRTTEAEASKAALAASADEGSAEASSAALAEEEDADSRMLRRFQKLCIRKGGRRGRKVPDFSHAIAARAVRLCNLAGRTEVYGDGPATLAWLSLAASFEGQPAEFMVMLHKGPTKREASVDARVHPGNESDRGLVCIQKLTRARSHCRYHHLRPTSHCRSHCRDHRYHHLRPRGCPTGAAS